MEADRENANVGPDPPDGSSSTNESSAATSKQPRRRVIGRRAALAEDAASKAQDTSSSISTSQALAPSTTAQSKPRIASAHQVPSSLLNDPALQSALSLLPSNYNFEIPKTIHRIRSTPSCKSVALQFPEGLLLFAPTISDILQSFCPGIDTVILGDVTYGACCVDDYTARALGCDLLVHYGHSCLVPLDSKQAGGLKTLYVFVTIGIDTEHLLATIERNFTTGKRLALVGTIQFNNTLQSILPRLRSMGFDPFLPRTAPLSAGEILGCTAPTLTALSSTSTSSTTLTTPLSPHSTAPPDPKRHEADLLLYVGDGRFHLESIMIASPSLRSHSYRYDPYSRRLTHEQYNHHEMHSLRSHAVNTARKTLSPSAKGPIPPTTAPKSWGLILGTLGRQGNPSSLSLLELHLHQRHVPTITLLLSEITPAKLALMSADVAVWVQVACPRLSVDWGYAFERPLLSVAEGLVALGVRDGAWVDGKSGGDGVDGGVGEGENEKEEEPPVYEMDYYAKDGLGRVDAKEVERVERLFEGGRMEVEVR